ncbi:MAG TPA: LPS export ABC transporter permease LptF [Gammaproteobacteria bacterium]
MSSIERYVIREILKPLSAVVAILASLFACFSGARYLAEAVTESLGMTAMLKLVILKTVIALEVMVPVALYAAVVIALGRLHRDQEIIAMRAAGLSSISLVRAVLWLSVPVGIVVGTLSMAGRPWAYEGSYLIDAQAQAEFDAERMQPGRFYGNEDSGRVSYVQAKTADGRMKGVFLYRRRDGASEIIIARSGEQTRAELDRQGQLHLHDGVLYKLMHAGAADSTVSFTRLVYFLKDPEAVIGYKRKAAATGDLLASDRPQDIAELQWRLSRPLATVLLALVAIPLSRASFRQGKHERSIAAALVFAVYYNLSGLAQAWVEQGTVGAFPGVWWLQGLMFAAVALFLRGELRRSWAARA